MTGDQHKNSDEIELERIQVLNAQQDPAKFDVLYNKYYKPIFTFIYRRTTDEELTADLTSQVFIKALTHLQKFRFKGIPFSAWLYRIACNEINQFYRKGERQRVVSIDSSSISVFFEDSEDHDKEECYLILKRALNQLNPDAMLLIELRFFEKRSFAEIGDIIGITENNAKVTVYRILDKLKKMISPLIQK